MNPDEPTLGDCPPVTTIPGTLAVLKEEIIQEWLERTRTSVKGTSALAPPILVNTIPPFYDSLVQAVAADSASDIAAVSTTLPSEHGGERARMTNYDPEALINEYQILRAAIFASLERHDVAISLRERAVLNTSIDNAMRESVTAFSLAVTALREQFLAALTHDLRTPLHAARMAAELIMLNDNPARMKELAGTVTRNLQCMGDMIGTLLDTMVFHHGQRLQLELTEFDIAEVAKEVCQQLLSHGTNRYVITGGPIHGWWDRNAIKRVIENLVGNAIKYGSDAHPVRIQMTVTHGEMMLSVHNEGVPIPVEEQETVFQPFRRARIAKETGKKGWGIGLPYVRAVAESHGGSIVIESAADVGTTFTLSMPLDARPHRDVPTLG